MSQGGGAVCARLCVQEKRDRQRCIPDVFEMRWVSVERNIPRDVCGKKFFLICRACSAVVAGFLSFNLTLCVKMVVIYLAFCQN